MGKANKKTGKARLDVWYRKAKEQGYRARSAFKLVHLNRKYDLLSKCKVVIDLCAAPGGWLQVAEKYMPKGGLIVGVDLDPIKPIPHVATFVNDITTASCRNQIRGYLKHFEADLVMHDGAPNVGTAWVQDAFTQSELVLQSLKLATEFLRKGGSFVTKVFRSGDYNSLMWVFNQLFGKVEATKPPSSRNVSAEIFVVCQDFLKPKYIDPKFLDPKHVFKELSSAVAAGEIGGINGEAGPDGVAMTNSGATQAIKGTNIFAPEKKQRQREGYAEGDYTLFREKEVKDFIHASTALDAIAVLSSCNKLVFGKDDQQKAWYESRHTTDDILEDLRDLKVLGKGDFKRLIKWRLAIRLETGLDVKKSNEDDNIDEDAEGDEEPVDEEQQVTEEMARLHREALIRAKREKRKANEKKARALQRRHLNMTAPEDLDLGHDADLAGEDVFDLGQGEKELRRSGKKQGKASLVDLVKDADGLDEEEDEQGVTNQEEDDDEMDYLSSEDEREARTAMLEGALDDLYEAYRERMNERDAKWKVKQARLKDKNRQAWHGIQKDGDDSDADSAVGDVQADAEAESDDEDSVEGGYDLVVQSKSRDEDSDSSDDSASEISASDNEEDKAPRKRVKAVLPGATTTVAKPARSSTNLVANLGADVEKAEMSRAAQVWFDQDVFKGMDDLADLDGSDGDDESMEDGSDDEEEEGVEEEQVDERSEDESDFEIVPAEPEDDTRWDVDDEDQDEVKQKKIKERGLLTAEAVTLATALVNRKTTAEKLIDDGFNRHNFNSKDDLPSWFLDDEAKIYKPRIPVTKEAVAALRAKQRALDARPIKKVAEAKARKKFKAHQRLEKAKKKAEGLLDAPDTTERDKAAQVAKVLGKAVSKPKRKELKVVVARGANRGVKGRPKGVKGRYKILDPRMRKEMRAEKRIKKANKKRSH